MRAELELEVATPMFLAGANQQQAELRPASVRGQLRYWFRAILGGVIGDQNLSALADTESFVFGDTQFNSPVTVRLSAPDKQPSDCPLLPHRPNSGQASAFPPGTRFNLILSLARHGSAQQLEMATWAALVWLSLGGLGRRSRRGAGSVRVRDLIALPESFPTALKDALRLTTTPADDADALADSVEFIVRSARREFRRFASNAASQRSAKGPSFSILQDSTGIAVKPTDAEPLVWLMETMSELKRSMGSTRFAEVFGGIGSDNFGGNRRASPLHVTLHRTRTGPALLFTYLDAAILPGRDGHPEEGRAFLMSLDAIAVDLTGGDR